MRRTSLLILSGALLIPTACDEPAAEPDDPPASDEQATDPTADEEPMAGTSEPEGPPNPLALPDELSAVLRQEMLALEPAMGELATQLARGQREEAAGTAMRIHDSFILKQELSEEQLRTLVSSVPEDFVSRDRAFHQMAAGVAHAAEAGELGEATRLYGDMATACVSCHSEHAATRFPGLEGVQVPAPEPPTLPEGAQGDAHGHAHGGEQAGDHAAEQAGGHAH